MDSFHTNAKYFDSNQLNISEKPPGDLHYFGLPDDYIYYEKKDIVYFDLSYF